MSSLSPGPGIPPLVAVSQPYTGTTIAEALGRFEAACSDEDFDSVVIQECSEHADGVLVRYEVRWKYSVFDEHPYGSHLSWALLLRSHEGSADPADTRYRVAAATAAHHML
jgi:hypothetical protein